MGSKNDTIVNGVENLSQEDLVDVYEKLAESYRKLKQDNDECKQKLHHQTQQAKMLISSQNDLQNEYDNIHSVHMKELRELEKKNASTVDYLKQSNKELLAERIQLETRNDDLSRQLDECKRKCEELNNKLIDLKPAPRMSDSFSRNLEFENENLKLTLNEMEAQLSELSKQISDKNARIEELNEERLCLEDNLESRKSEIDEKNEAMESLQEKVHELTMELAMAHSAPVDANRKGNSLFAEVDDQRQQLKTIIKIERNELTEMKKKGNSREIEIRRLKRENMNIKKEIEACSSLLSRGEQIAAQTKLSQITQLENDNRNLEQRLASTEKKLIDLAKEQNFEWIESLLSMSNNDTRCFKEKLFIMTAENTKLADSLCKSQRELAQARLNCVKFKMLIDRIVVAHNIKLNQEQFYDIGFDEEVFEGFKIEEFETIDESIEQASMFEPEALNESTINLIGGRERLGHFVPPPVVAKTFNDLTLVAEKENFPIIKQEVISPEPEKLFEHVKSPVKLKREVPVAAQKLESEKLVKFSNVNETKVIDQSEEQFVQSQKARKRLPVTVKRIVIPSRAPVKTFLDKS